MTEKKMIEFFYTWNDTVDFSICVKRRSDYDNDLGFGWFYKGSQMISVN